MYGKKTWGGPVDPFILVKYLNADKDKGSDPISSLLIFEWKDLDLVGIPDPNGFGNVSSKPPSNRVASAYLIGSIATGDLQGKGGECGQVQ